MATKKQAHWSGRFAETLDPLALRFTASLKFDKQLYFYDILGSYAHAEALQKAKVLKPAEVKKIQNGLLQVLKKIRSGKFQFHEKWEDVHRNIEQALIKEIGPLGGKLHTGRSRNDQVALDLRLYCREQLVAMNESLVQLERVVLKRAREFLGVLMPGYTHLQRAQPVLFSHWLMAYVEMWERDRARVTDCLKRVNTLPLGAGALSGTTFPIDREAVAEKLGFFDVSHNSLDAVSDRDFAIEIASVGSLIMMHLSRISEELILWSSAEFGFIRLPESFCTGSSMMPQKINPDVPELIRGKSGRVYGHLVSLLTMMKSLPLAYNKDMQEDKEPLFDLFDTVTDCLELLRNLLAKLRLRPEKMREAIKDGFLLATEMADYLVTRGVPFREAHEITGNVVRDCLQKNKRLEELTLAQLKSFSPKFEKGIFAILTPEKAVARRKVTGGTSPERVRAEIKRIEKRLG
ncbi:MAG: argininosuccinate lyase [Deltaproteobacteria bacterium]|nr:argininosuccinate lyase [Deltaproteobacteria bacterium]